MKLNHITSWEVSTDAHGIITVSMSGLIRNRKLSEDAYASTAQAVCTAALEAVQVALEQAATDVDPAYRNTTADERAAAGSRAQVGANDLLTPTAREYFTARERAQAGSRAELAPDTDHEGLAPTDTVW